MNADFLSSPMNFTKKLRNILTNDWVIGFFLLGVFLLTNGYTYGWDDQHVEIPLLKKLIDPNLYVGDYYVESLVENFTSFLFPVLARVISVDQVPATYFILYLLSRFFLFFWIYKLWHLLSDKKLTGVLCTVMIIVLGRVEEFLYRTFSHQEFALAIIFAGIYFFYKERFILAAAILGIAANFHSLYSLFPFVYMTTYLLWHIKKYHWKTLAKTIGTFTLIMSPILIWTLKKRFAPIGAADPNLTKNWIDLYLLACPQNFTFNQHSLSLMMKDISTFFTATREYWLLLSFYILNILHNPVFKKDKKSQAVMLIGTVMLTISFITSYVTPNRFVTDLNLIRNIQFMLFFLMGHTIILLVDRCKKEPWGITLLLAILFPLIRFGNYVGILAGAAMTLLLSARICWKWPLKGREGILRGLGLLILAGLIIITTSGIIKDFAGHSYSKVAIKILWGTWISFFVPGIAYFFVKSTLWRDVLRKLLIIIPLIALTGNYLYYHRLHIKVEKTAGGFWQLQRNWIDMQKYVKENTPVDALILVPHDMEMGGFRIHSEREIVLSYRDCGVVGFDYNAGVEWQRRLKDMDAFQVFIKKSITTAIMKAVMKYKVNYIVFMGYGDPGNNSILQSVYKNETFALYKVIPNPI
ncbi:MAG: hypothetical protein KAJ18_08540 [Candidatus Omnitrophica bacterium]|nr:hypothetical protein [Candidatus Omnitrophota bacterium]